MRFQRGSEEGGDSYLKVCPPDVYDEKLFGADAVLFDEVVEVLCGQARGCGDRGRERGVPRRGRGGSHVRLGGHTKQRAKVCASAGRSESLRRRQAGFAKQFEFGPIHVEARARARRVQQTRLRARSSVAVRTERVRMDSGSLDLKSIGLENKELAYLIKGESPTAFPTHAPQSPSSPSPGSSLSQAG